MKVLLDIGIEVNIIIRSLIDQIGLLLRLDTNLILVVYIRDKKNFNSIYKDIEIRIRRVVII